MNWTELLEQEIEETYRVAGGLLDLVDDEALDWKPATGSNWMTTGQLLKHMTTACGALCRGFVTGDWPMPAGAAP
ncbi:MAG: DinB family protein, partial [Planctomycetota bacterium]